MNPMIKAVIIKAIDTFVKMVQRIAQEHQYRLHFVIQNKLIN